MTAQNKIGKAKLTQGKSNVLPKKAIPISYKPGNQARPMRVGGHKEK